MKLSCPLGTTRRVPQGKLPRKSYNKSFTDQACWVKMAGYWPRTFFACLWTSTASRSTTEHAKKELGQYPAILTSHLVNNLWALSIRPKVPEIPVKSEWKGHFPGSHSGIFGVPRELVPIFRKLGKTGKFRSIRPFLLGPVSPRR